MDAATGRGAGSTPPGLLSAAHEELAVQLQDLSDRGAGVKKTLGR